MPLINCVTCSGTGKTSAQADCIHCNGTGCKMVSVESVGDLRHALITFPPGQTQDGNPATDEVDEEAAGRVFREAVDRATREMTAAASTVSFVSAARGISMASERCKKCEQLIVGGVYVVAGERPYCKVCFDVETHFDANQQTGEIPAMVSKPPHYQQVPGIECIDVTQHFNFNKGNAIKYVWRAGAKGNEVEDLRKAIQYCEFEIARLEGRPPHAAG